MLKYNACQTTGLSWRALYVAFGRTKWRRRSGERNNTGPEHAPACPAYLSDFELEANWVGQHPGKYKRATPTPPAASPLPIPSASIPSLPFLSHSAGRVPRSIVAILLGISRRRQCHSLPTSRTLVAPAESSRRRFLHIYPRRFLLLPGFQTATPHPSIFHSHPSSHLPATFHRKLFNTRPRSHPAQRHSSMSLVQRVTSIEGTDRVEPPQLDSLFAHGYQNGYGTTPSHAPGHGLRHQPSVQPSLRHVPSYQRSLRHVISYDALADPEEPSQAENPAGGVSQYTISTARRVAQVCFTVLCCWLASGLLFGFAALKPVLVDQGVYREYCTVEELEEGVELCYKQDLRYVKRPAHSGHTTETDLCAD